MRYYSNKMIRDFIKCPQFGDTEYGKWSALPLEVRETIKRLLDINEELDKYALAIAKIKDLNTMQFLKEKHFKYSLNEILKELGEHNEL